MKPPKGLRFPFGGAFPFPPFLHQALCIYSLLTRIHNLMEAVMRRCFQKVPIQDHEENVHSPGTQLPFLNIQATPKRVLINLPVGEEGRQR